MSDDKLFQDISEFKAVTESDLFLDQIIPNIEEILFTLQPNSSENESMSTDDKMTFYNSNAQLNLLISQKVESLRNSLQRARESINNHLTGDGCDLDVDTQRKLLLARSKILIMKDDLLEKLQNDLELCENHF